MILENMGRTDREQTDRQTDNSKPEAILIPVDSWGERANYVLWWTRPWIIRTLRYVLCDCLLCILIMVLLLGLWWPCGAQGY